MTDHKKTRLIEPVECGLDAEDLETLRKLRDLLDIDQKVNPPADHSDSIDFLDRLPEMIKQRDEELADHEYHTLCAKLEADTARQILADAIAQSNGSRDLQRLSGQNCQHSGTSDDETIHRLRDLVEFQKLEIRRLRGLLDGESHG